VSLGAFGLRAWLCRTSEGDSPIFAARKSGQSPSCLSTGPNAGGADAAQAVWDALLLTGVLFALAKLALVALVEMMVPRYVFAAGVLLPSVLTLAAWRHLEAIAARIPGRTDLPETRLAPSTGKMHVPRKASNPI